MSLCGILIVAACTTNNDLLTIDDAYIEMQADGTYAAYMVIENSGRAAVAVTRIEAEFAEIAEIRQVITEGTLSFVEPIDGELVVPAGDSIVLEPHLRYVTFINPLEGAMSEARARFTLYFDNGNSVVVSAPIQRTSARPTATAQASSTPVPSITATDDP